MSKDNQDNDCVDMSEDVLEIPQGETAPLQEQLDEALREKNQFHALAQRAQADLVNYRHRASEEQEEARRFVRFSLLLKILSGMDDLNQAIHMAPQDTNQDWLNGIRLVLRNLESILVAEGATRIEATGQPFEPRDHEALYYEATLEAEQGTVLEVFREGYRLNDRLLRAAQVSVAKTPEPHEESKEDISDEFTECEQEKE